MDLFEALYTTRAMRRVRPDAIPDDVVQRIVDAGIRAPSGGNTQQWRFLVVTDPTTREQLAVHYKSGIDWLFANFYKDMVASAESGDPADPATQQQRRVLGSAQWLADHFAEVPLLIFGYIQGGATGGSSIYPALWSMQLAARAFGVGSTLTTILSMHAKEVDGILGVPEDSGFSMAGCVPMGYPVGKWGIASRRPAEQVAFAERWGKTPAWSIPEPLWSPLPA